MRFPKGFCCLSHDDLVSNVSSFTYKPDYPPLKGQLLEGKDVDFVWSNAQRMNLRTGAIQDVVGGDTLTLGNIDTSTILCRMALMARENWRAAGYNSNWNLVRRWLSVGASSAHLPEVTVMYHRED